MRSTIGKLATGASALLLASLAQAQTVVQAADISSSFGHHANARAPAVVALCNNHVFTSYASDIPGKSAKGQATFTYRIDSYYGPACDNGVLRPNGAAYYYGYVTIKGGGAPFTRIVAGTYTGGRFVVLHGSEITLVLGP
ncbi:MAG: hypothetical protein M3Z16_01360 [Pseudomonadota bacterium]|nr:hypothetical protein [Pseudomonadota bacterium]